MAGDWQRLRQGDGTSRGKEGEVSGGSCLEAAAGEAAGLLPGSEMPRAPAEGRILAFLRLVLSCKWGSCQLRIKSRHLGPMAAGLSVWGPRLTDLAVGCLCI